MGRSRAVLAVLFAAWLGLVSVVAAGGAAERFPAGASAGSALGHAGAAVSDATGAVLAPPDRWSKRVDTREDLLGVAVAVVLLAGLCRHWRRRPSVRQPVPAGRSCRSAAPRAPPA